MEEVIREFIEWAHVNSPDAWWIYENTDEAIEKFMEQKQAGGNLNNSRKK